MCCFLGQSGTAAVGHKARLTDALTCWNKVEQGIYLFLFGFRATVRKIGCLAYSKNVSHGFQNKFLGEANGFYNFKACTTGAYDTNLHRLHLYFALDSSDIVALHVLWSLSDATTAA
jgi:hypothetical protein